MFAARPPDDDDPTAALHAAREVVNVDCKLTPQQLTTLRDMYPSHDFRPLPHCESRPHSLLRVSRQMASRNIYSQLRSMVRNGEMNTDAVVASIGSNPTLASHYFPNFSQRMHHLCPTVDAADAVRHRSLDSKMDVLRICEHRVGDCTCTKNWDVTIDTDVSYYLTRDDILTLVHTSRTGRHFSAVLNFDRIDDRYGCVNSQLSPAGHYFDEAAWSLSYDNEENQLMVSMCAQGGGRPYFHPLNDWLNLRNVGDFSYARHYHKKDTSLAMSWDVVSIVGPFLILCFVRDKPRDEPPVPAPRASLPANETHPTRIPTSMINRNLRAPGVEPSTDRHSQLALAITCNYNVVVVNDAAMMVGVRNGTDRYTHLTAYPAAMFSLVIGWLDRKKRAKDEYVSSVATLTTLIKAQYNLPTEALNSFFRHIYPILYYHLPKEGVARLAPVVNADRPFLTASYADRYNALLEGLPDYWWWHAIKYFLVWGFVSLLGFAVLDLTTSSWVTVTEREYSMVTSLGQSQCVHQVRRTATSTSGILGFLYPPVETEQTVCSPPYAILTGDYTIPGRWPRINDGSAFRMSVGALQWVHGVTDSLIRITEVGTRFLPGILAHIFKLPPALAAPIQDVFSLMPLAMFFGLMVVLGRVRLAPASFSDWVGRVRTRAAATDIEYQMGLCVIGATATYVWPGLALLLILVIVAHHAVRVSNPLIYRATTMHNVPVPAVRPRLEGLAPRVRLSDNAFDSRSERPVVRQDIITNHLRPVVCASNPVNLHLAVRGRTTQPVPLHFDADTREFLPYDADYFDRFEERVFGPLGVITTFSGTYEPIPQILPLSVRRMIIAYAAVTFKKHIPSTPKMVWCLRFPVAARLRLQEADRKLSAGEVTDNLMFRRSAFGKVELSEFIEPELEDVEASATPRAIITVSDYMKVETGPFCHGCSGFLKRHWTVDDLLVYAPGLRQDEIGAIFTRWARRGENSAVVFEADMKRFDSTLNSRLLSIPTMLWRRFTYDFTEHGNDPVKLLERQHALSFKNHDFGISVSGVYGRGSGSMNTTSDNTVILLVSVADTVASVIGCDIADLHPDALLPEHRVQILGGGDDLTLFREIPFTTSQRSEIVSRLIRLGLQPKASPHRIVTSSTFFSARPWCARVRDGDEWVESMVMGPKIGRFLVRMFCILDPINKAVLLAPTSYEAIMAAALHYYRVAECYLHCSPHVPIVAPIAAFVLAELRDLVEPLVLEVRAGQGFNDSLERQLEHRRRQAPRAAVEVSVLADAQVFQVYGLTADDQAAVVRAYTEHPFLDRLRGYAPRAVELPVADPLFAVDLASFWRVATIAAFFAVPALEELAKETWVGFMYICCAEAVFRSCVPATFHVVSGVLPFVPRLIAHYVYNLYIARQAGLLAAGFYWAAGRTNLHKDRKAIPMPRHGGKSGHATQRGRNLPGLIAALAGSLAPAIAEKVAKAAKQPAKTTPTHSKPASQPLKAKTPVPKEEVKSASKPAPPSNRMSNKPPKRDAELKPIVGAKPVVVDPVRGPGAHDLVNFEHPVAVIAGGAPVAIRADMGATDMLAAADKKVVKYGNRSGVAMTLRARFPVDNVNGNAAASVTATRQYNVNPADPTSCALISPLVRCFDAWKLKHWRNYVRTESSTASVGRINLSYDPEVTDIPPLNKLQAESIAGSKAFAPWENSDITFPRKYASRQAFYYTSDGVADDGDQRVTSPGKLYVTVADNADSNKTLAEVWCEVEIELFAATFGNGSFVPPPARFQAGGNNTLITMTQSLMSSVTADQHTAVPGAASTVPGSNPDFSLTAGLGTSTTGTTDVRLLFPMSGNPNTAGQTRPGSYLVSVLFTATAVTLTGPLTITIIPQNDAFIHNGATFNGMNDNVQPTVSFQTGATPFASGHVICCRARVDTLGSSAGFSYTTSRDGGTGLISQWALGPSCVIRITGTAADLSGIFCLIDAAYVSTVLPAAINLTITTDEKTQVAEITERSTLVVSDGIVVATKRLPDMRAAPKVVMIDRNAPPPSVGKDDRDDKHDDDYFNVPRIAVPSASATHDNTFDAVRASWVARGPNNRSSSQPPARRK